MPLVDFNPFEVLRRLLSYFKKMFLLFIDMTVVFEFFVNCQIREATFCISPPPKEERSKARGGGGTARSLTLSLTGSPHGVVIGVCV